MNVVPQHCTASRQPSCFLRLFGCALVAGALLFPQALSAGWPATPTDVTANGIFAQVAADSSGNLVAVWTYSEYVGGSEVISIMARRYTPAAGWDAAPTTLSSGAFGSEPRVVMDGSGNATVVWSADPDVKAVRYTAGTGWGTVETLGTGSTHRVAVDGSGNVTVVWSRSYGYYVGTTIQATRYSASAWSTAVDLQTADANAKCSNPDVVADSSGNVTAVWQVDRKDPTPRLNVVQASRSSDGVNWSTPENLSDTTKSSSVPHVAVDGTGVVTAGFKQASDQSVQAIRYSASAWGSRTAIGAVANAYPGDDFAVAADSTGNVTVVWPVWVDATPGTYQTWAIRYSGGSWGTVATLRSVSDSYPTPKVPAVAISSDGSVTAAWLEGTNNQFDFRAVRYTSGSWGSAAVLSPTGYYAERAPAVAAGGTSLVVVWSIEIANGDPYKVQASIFAGEAGPASKLAFTKQPGGGTSGTAWTTQPEVTIQDASGNTTTSTATVTLAITTPGGGILTWVSDSGPNTVSGGNLTCTANPTAATRGVAAFAGCKLLTAGQYTLTATSGTLTSAQTSSFTVTAGAASQLAFTTNPSPSGTPGTPWAQQPVVTAQDANGNTDTTYVSTVTLALASGTGTLTCTTNPVTAVAGVATFAGCKVNAVGAFTLKATSGTMTNTTTNPSIVVSLDSGATVPALGTVGMAALGALLGLAGLVVMRRVA